MADKSGEGGIQKGLWARFLTYLEKSLYPTMLLAKWGFAWVIAAFYVDFIPDPIILRDVHQYPDETVVILSFLIFLIAGDAARYHKSEVWMDD